MDDVELSLRRRYLFSPTMLGPPGIVTRNLVTMDSDHGRKTHPNVHMSDATCNFGLELDAFLYTEESSLWPQFEFHRYPRIWKANDEPPHTQ